MSKSKDLWHKVPKNQPLSAEQYKAGWRRTRCISCRGRGKIGKSQCDLCDGTGKIITHV